ncbi:AAA family ATPase [Candidatus Bathyarchaeota archaeon ex4484_135]|nr:MAG: AAA family ATPase [Candidatus Bathyarchaeota archaeon ex4484_135]
MYQEELKTIDVEIRVRPVPKEPEPPKPLFENTRETRRETLAALKPKKKPGITWDDIVGLEEAKRAIKEAIIYPVLRPDLFPHGWPRGILLFGPPGCGKTLLASAVAHEIDAEFIEVSGADIMNKWLGEAEKNVARLFSRAREVAEKGRPAIIFIDEVDSLLGTYNNEVGGEVRVRNQFLREMDGINDKTKKLHVYVIGATNKPWNLDLPFIRRFQRRILVPPPDFEARVGLFRLYTKGIELADDVDLEELAHMTEGYTGSDIRDICLDAYYSTVRELFESGKALEAGSKPRPVGRKDFLLAIRSRRPSVKPNVMRLYQEWYEEFGAL